MNSFRAPGGKPLGGWLRKKKTEGGAWVWGVNLSGTTWAAGKEEIELDLTDLGGEFQKLAAQR